MEAITVPKLGQTMETAVIEKWHVKEGDQLNKGDVVLEITTDKATLEVESYVAGTVRKIVVSEGEEKEVGSVIAFVGDPGEEIPDVAEIEKETKAAVAQPEPQPAAPAAAPAPAPAAKGAKPGRVRATPRAKKLAREMGVDMAHLQGTGPGGRITEDDVKAGASGATAAPAPTPVAGIAEKKPLSAMRRVVAERMTQSAREAPHFYLNMDIDMTSAVELREKLKAEYKLSYNDMIMRACAIGISEMPDVNSTWLGDAVGIRSSIDIGLAVGLEDGLIVPVVREADTKSLKDIAANSVELIEKARGHKLMPDDYGNASMTVSNLGMFGIASFQPVVNLGESVIMGVGAIAEKAIGIDGNVVLRKLMTITLSCDHRVIDGAVGAQFLARVRELLENPDKL
ncbi:dihydrolipoamide acetyltransferase family protein [Planctomycetota bacterium]